MEKVNKKLSGLLQELKRRKKDRVLRFGNLTFILTDNDYIFEEDGEKIHLSEETGWWEYDRGKMTIYIYRPGIESLKKLGIGVHEFVESILVNKLKLPLNWGHRVANILEKIVSLGRADLYWR